MICVECCEPIEALFYKYKGDHIKLTVCDVCHKVADRYVEYDKVLMFIDLMLLKQQAYRHLIYNHLTNKGDSTRGIDSSVSFVRRYNTIVRLLVLVLLFEVYLTWAYEEKNFVELQSKQPTAMTRVILENRNLFAQYAYFLSKAVLEFFLTNVTIQCILYFWFDFGHAETITFEKVQSHNFLKFSPSPESDSSDANSAVVIVKQFHYPRSYFVAIVSTTILVSNLIKLFPIVMLIWPYDISILNLTKTLVLFIHTIILIETVHIVLLNNPKNDYWRVALTVFSSNMVKTLVGQFVLVSLVSRVYGLSWLELAKDEYLAVQQKILVFEQLLK